MIFWSFLSRRWKRFVAEWKLLGVRMETEVEMLVCLIDWDFSVVEAFSSSLKVSVRHLFIQIWFRQKLKFNFFLNIIRNHFQVIRRLESFLAYRTGWARLQPFVDASDVEDMVAAKHSDLIIITQLIKAYNAFWRQIVLLWINGSYLDLPIVFFWKPVVNMILRPSNKNRLFTKVALDDTMIHVFFIWFRSVDVNALFNLLFIIMSVGIWRSVGITKHDIEESWDADNKHSSTYNPQHSKYSLIASIFFFFVNFVSFKQSVNYLCKY